MERSGSPVNRRSVVRAPHIHRCLMGGIVGLQGPLDIVDPAFGRVLPVLMVLMVLALAAACVRLIRAGHVAKREARSAKDRYSRELDELERRQEIRIREALERGADGAQELAQADVRERLVAVMRTIREGFAHLEQRLNAAETQEQERVAAIRTRMDEAMTDMRRAGKATIRIMLDRFGLPGVLEDLRWSLELPGTVRVGLRLEGIPTVLDKHHQVGIYHLVNDAVDAAMGRKGVSRLDIRLEGTQGGCLLSVESDGGERIAGHPTGEAGDRRLEARAASLQGVVSTTPLPHGGRALRVEFPLGQ